MYWSIRLVKEARAKRPGQQGVVAVQDPRLASLLQLLEGVRLGGLLPLWGDAAGHYDLVQRFEVAAGGANDLVRVVGAVSPGAGEGVEDVCAGGACCDATTATITNWP